MGVLPDGRAVTALQSALIEAPPGAAVPGLRVAARYAAAEAAQVGGDWYDTAPLPDGKVLIAVGDVSGHGLLAAAGMSQLRHALRGMASTGAEPAQILSWLNQMICHQRPGYVATAICARYNPANRTLTWARAGHLPPLLVRADDVTALPPPEGIVLGAVADASYAASVVHLEPRDFVLMFTDGLVERRGDELGHGLNHLGAVVRDHPGADVQECVDQVMRRLCTPDPEDDTCLVGIQID